MSSSRARIAALDVLRRVEKTEAFASELLHSSRYASLSPQDHHLATELVMGVLRWQSWLDARIAERSSHRLNRLDVEVLIALRIGVYQLFFLQRVPQRAAVHEAVELVKHARKESAASFVNAVLRKITSIGGRRKPIINKAETPGELAESTAHPSWLVERWGQAFGLINANKVCEYNQQIPSTTIRLHDASAEQELKGEGIQLLPGHLLSSGRRLVSGDLIRARVFREGRVTIQDEASQLIALLVGHGSKILDCCAAPGGKTRIIAERNPDALVLAADLYPHRAQLVRSRLTTVNAHVVASDARALPVTTLFDRILVDVPCSGTGTLARNPEIKWRLTPADLGEIQVRQLAILQSAMRQVAPRGRLVYSTCSLENEENIEVVDRALAEDKSFHVLDSRKELDQLRAQGELVWSDVGSSTHGPYLRTIPGVHPCDGFFGAILERK
jgi:16S rRNA (cytosine967-C5)-methyltransferase